MSTLAILRAEGKAEGKAEGIEIGLELAKKIKVRHSQGKSRQPISKLLKIDVKKVREIIEILG